MFYKCPGAANLRTPTLKIKKCPECNGDIEIFSTDRKVNCENCGFTVYNDIESCIQWCSYAKECVGDELINKIKKSQENKNWNILCIKQTEIILSGYKKLPNSFSYQQNSIIYFDSLSIRYFCIINNLYYVTVISTIYFPAFVI